MTARETCLLTSVPASAPSTLTTSCTPADRLKLIDDSSVCRLQGNVKVVVTITSDVNLRLHGALLPDCAQIAELPDALDMSDMSEALAIPQDRIFSFLEGAASVRLHCIYQLHTNICHAELAPSDAPC